MDDCECFRGPVGDDTEVWNWILGPWDPRYYTPDQKSSLRFANPTITEDRRLHRIFQPSGTTRIPMFAKCVALVPVDWATLDRKAGPLPTLRHFPVLDDKSFRAGELDITISRASSSEHTELNYIFHLRSEIREGQRVPLTNNNDDWQLVCLSRFTGMADTQEAPHWATRQTLEPCEAAHQRMLNNIKPSIECNDEESEDPFVETDDKPHGDKHRWTYDPRRYEREKYYPFYNVLVVQWRDGIAYRQGIGQVHVDAFERVGPEMQLVVLG